MSAEPLPIEAIRWITSNDTGTSSETIWSVMAGAPKKGGSRPSDPSDFGRCYRLFWAVPEWRERIGEMVAAYPDWGPLVAIWDELEAMFIDVAGVSGADGWNRPAAERLYKRMKSIDADCMRAGGWAETGPGSWTRGQASSVKVGKVTFNHGD